MERDVVSSLITSLIKERFVASEVMTSVCFLEKRKHPVISLFTGLESSQIGSKITEVHEIPIKKMFDLSHLFPSRFEIFK
jgi:hypothetical protein